MEASVVSFDGWRPRGSSQADPSGVDKTGSFRLSSPAGLEAARRYALAQEPELVHVHDPMLWDFAASIAQTTLSPTVATFHVLHSAMNSLRGLDGDTMSSKNERVVAEQVDLIHATTPWVAKALSGWGGTVESRVRMSPLGIDDTEGAARSRASSKEGSILYVGRFSDVKGTDTLIDALQQKGSQLGTIRVVGGLPHNRKREARWKKRFEEATPGCVEFLGWLEGEQLAACYAEASILVVPSRLETFGQVALEGLLHGVPVLASRCDAFIDWLMPHDAAHFFEVGNAHDLADQLMSLRLDDAARSRLHRRGPEVALSALSWSRSFPALEALYREL